jgi:hypothetical protein
MLRQDFQVNNQQAENLIFLEFQKPLFLFFESNRFPIISYAFLALEYYN